MNVSDVTIVIPYLDSKNERFLNICQVINSIKKTNIKLVVSEQHNGASRLRHFIETYDDIVYVEYVTSSMNINKSRLVNMGVNAAATQYIWQVDADVILKWEDVLNNIHGNFDAIKPFEYVVRLDKLDTDWYYSNGKIKIKKGDIKETVAKFGPLSFIIKKSIFQEECGMNERFEGWSWEDIEFARRIQRKYDVHTVGKSYGIHLWHPAAESNEEHNKPILDECENEKGVVVLKNEPPVVNDISEEIKKKSEHVFTSAQIIEGAISLYNKLTVLIPVKIDTDDRIRNLKFVLSYFKENFKDFELIVIEQDVSSKVDSIVNNYGFKHVFRKNEGCFHKTWNFNYGISLAKNEYIIAYDCDAIFKPEAIRTSLDRLVSKETSFIFPYNSYMLEIKKPLFSTWESISRNTINELPTVNHVNKNILNSDNITILYGDIKYDCTGGAFMFSKEEMLKCGGYNPNIISYGCEDNEIEVRVKNLGYKVERNSSFNAYHLEHGRSTDSHYNNFFDNNLKEFNKIQKMSGDILWDYVNNGFKGVKFDNRMDLQIVNDEFNYSISLSKHQDKRDLSDVDIIIPTFIDTDDRFRNITCNIKYIEKYFVNYKIYLIEMQSDRCKILYHNKNVEYRHIDKSYNKTTAINIGINLCNRKMVCVWDVDAIIKPEGIVDSIDSILNGGYKISYPYSGWFVDIDGSTLHNFTKTLEYSKLVDYPTNKETPDYKVRFSTRNQTSGGGNNGGCVIFDRDTLVKCGNYNENFYQWGFEDDEIEARFEILGYKRYNSKLSTCYHMNHARSPEENGFGTEYWTANYEEYAKVCNMSKEQLQRYADNDFIDSVGGITVVFDKVVSNEELQVFISNPLIKDIFVINDIDNIKCITYNSGTKKLRGKDIHDFFVGQIVINNPNKDDIEDIKNIFEAKRRAIVTRSGKIYAFKKAHRESVKSGNISTFEKIEIGKCEDKPTVSILFTTYGKETLMTHEWMQRFVGWKDKKYEIIAVVHDESVLHREVLRYYKNIGVIDKLIFATKNHGHIKGLALATEYANGEYIAVVNNDILVSRECMEWCINELKSHINTGAIGWHYDDVDHRGTFWKNGKLEYSLRKNLNSSLIEKEISKLTGASWYTGKVLSAIGNEFKRLYLPNGSFIVTRTSLWKDIGGFCFKGNDHYFHDDWYSYGVLEMGFDIVNVPKEWGNSSNPSVFLSKTDYPWRGIQDKSKNVDSVGDDTESIVKKMICENKKVCILGDKTKLKGIVYNEVKYINEKCNVVAIYDYITSMEKLTPFMENDCTIIFDTNLSHVFGNNYPKSYNSYSIGNLGILSPVPTSRESFSHHQKQLSLNNSFVNIQIKNSDRQKFVILTQPRVGFNNLKSIIDKHNDVFLDHDIFKKDRTRITQVLDHKRIHEPKEFLESYWDLALISNDKKCNGYRYNVWDDPSSVPFTCIDGEYKIIMLKRDNIFNSMLDCAFAHQTGIWHTEKDIDNVDAFSINYEWASKWINGVKSTYNSWKSFYDENDIKYLEVSYEQIYSNGKVNLNGMLDYLGVDGFIVTPNSAFKNISTDIIYEAVTNKTDIDTLRNI